MPKRSRKIKVSTCRKCGKSFDARGLRTHERACYVVQETPSLFVRQLAVSLGKPDPANNIQHGGTHYQDGAGKCIHCGEEIQHWDIVRMFNLDYFIGNATKYLFRLGLKGDALEQIDKAIHYLQKKRESLVK